MCNLSNFRRERWNHRVAAILGGKPPKDSSREPNRSHGMARWHLFQRDCGRLGEFHAEVVATPTGWLIAACCYALVKDGLVCLISRFAAGNKWCLATFWAISARFYRASPFPLFLVARAVTVRPQHFTGDKPDSYLLCPRIAISRLDGRISLSAISLTAI